MLVVTASSSAIPLLSDSIQSVVISCEPTGHRLLIYRQDIVNVLASSYRQDIAYQVAQYRRGKRLRKLPAKFTLDLAHLPITEGRAIFIRWITARGRILLLGQSFRVGQGHKYQYAKVVLDTRRRCLTVYVVGKVLKRWPYKLSQH